MSKTIIIAEAGVNHNGDIDIAKKLIENAAQAGADYVKFQSFSAEELVTPNAVQASYQKKNTGVIESQYLMLKRLELKREEHLILMKHSELMGIKFLSSAFDIDALNFLDSLNLDLVKIPSGEITNLPYLCVVSKMGRPVVLSTGMSTLGDIEAAITILVNGGMKLEDLTILHCTTEYPAPPEEVNLKVIETLRTAFGVKVGYSDHTMGIQAPIAAVSLGATLIEKHFTLDRKMIGPDHMASLEPIELKNMVNAIRFIEKALGDGVKRVTLSESNNIKVARKSIVASQDIKLGNRFTAQNICIKRPGNGISPMRYEEVLGRIATRDFYANQLIEL